MKGKVRKVWLAAVSLALAGLSPAEEAPRMSLSFQELPVPAALQLLAQAANMQMLVSDSVTGTITLEIADLSHDEALALVLESRGLQARKRHGVWVVATPDEFLARDSARREAELAEESIAPLQLRRIRINYATASELAAVVAGSQSTLLSGRGTLQIDERSNTLIAHDTEQRLEKLAELLAELDLPARQVLIESRVVVANRNYSRNLGLRWGLTAADRRGDGRALVASGSGEAAGRIAEAIAAPEGSEGSAGALTAAALADRYNVNLPSAGAAGRFSIALLDPDYMLDLELAAMQAEGQGRLLSAPRVLASDQREASIRQGVEIPYQEAASSGATTTHFKHAALGLTVTPRITPNGRVILRLMVTKDSVGKIVATERGGAVPSIDTRRIETEVLVRDGQTLVLGGIRETENTGTQSSVPYLGAIPGVGRLFRSSIDSSVETELLVFVTPTILDPED